MLRRRACIECVYIHKSRLSFRGNNQFYVNRICDAPFKPDFERTHHEKADYRQYYACVRYSDVYAVLNIDKNVRQGYNNI